MANTILLMTFPDCNPKYAKIKHIYIIRVCKRWYLCCCKVFSILLLTSSRKEHNVVYGLNELQLDDTLYEQSCKQPLFLGFWGDRIWKHKMNSWPADSQYVLGALWNQAKIWTKNNIVQFDSWESLRIITILWIFFILTGHVLYSAIK